MSAYSQPPYYSSIPVIGRIKKLIDRIKAKINSNGDHQITGETLQKVLVDITQSLDKWQDGQSHGYTFSTDNIYFNKGNVSIGTSYIDSWYKLHVNGFVTSNNGMSDERLKTDIKPLGKVLSKIMKLQGVRYRWNREDFVMPNRDIDIGMIAQDVEKEFPELIERSHHEGYLGIEYGKFTAVLVEGIKELKKENDSLKRRVKKLEDKTK